MSSTFAVLIWPTAHWMGKGGEEAIQGFLLFLQLLSAKY
jgi:hypothetical protein